MNRIGTVLIVEDDADVLRAARIALGAHCEHIELLSSPSGIQECLSKMAFDVVLLDMNFAHGEHGGSEGLSTLAQIRLVDPTLSVVLMTAYGALSLAVDALKQGATDFILKPWRNEKLIATVTSAAQLTVARRGAETLELEVLERNAIKQALVRHEGNISAAAAALGLSRASLYRRMSKHGLE